MTGAAGGFVKGTVSTAESDGLRPIVQFLTGGGGGRVFGSGNVGTPILTGVLAGLSSVRPSISCCNTFSNSMSRSCTKLSIVSSSSSIIDDELLLLTLLLLLLLLLVFVPLLLFTGVTSLRKANRLSKSTDSLLC